MIPMKMDYIQEMRKNKIPGMPETLFNLENKYYEDFDAWNYYRYDSMSGQNHGSMILLYALKSYPHPTDNSKYALYFVTTQGIYMCTVLRSNKREPIEFRDITAKFVSTFGMRDVITLHPETRKLLLLTHTRYTEVIDGKAYPNTFDSRHMTSYLLPKSHYIILESDTHPPIKTEFNRDLLDSLRSGKPYIWVRSDNYMALSNLRFWHQNF